MSEAQRAVAAEISAGPRGSVRGPFVALLHNPALARWVQSLGEHLRFNTGLPRETVELVVLITARLWNCQYEWHSHEAIARKTGLPAAVIEAIGQGRKPEGLATHQANVWAFCVAMHRGAQISDEAFGAVERDVGLSAALDLIALCGYYAMLAMVLNTARLPLPDDAPDPLGTLPAPLPG